jgi:hypothetical protein
MQMQLNHLKTVWAIYAMRWRAAVAADRERGEVSTTTVILTFILAGLALAVGAIIVTKVTARANSIPTS